MPFDLSNLNPSTKFMYSENGEETGEYICLRLASDADNKRFFNSIGVKEKVEQIYNPKTRQMDRQTYFHTNEDQREQFNEIVWDFSITDWKLFSTEKDEDDNYIEIPCTTENKIKFMRESPLFATWTADCLETLREQLSTHAKAVRKN
jgi:hypothetical protein